MLPEHPSVLVWEALAEVAGGQTVALNLVDELDATFAFEFAVPGEGALSDALRKRDLPYHVVPVGEYELGTKGIRDVFEFCRRTPVALKQMVSLVQEFDVLYANSTRVFPWAALVGQLTGTPVVWHWHNILSDTLSRYVLEATGQFPAVKSILPVSGATANQSSMLQQKMRVVYNGVDVDQFSPGDVESTDEYVLGMVADLIPQKGHETAIEATERLQESIDVELRIAGHPREDTRKYERHLHELVAARGLSDHVTFLGYVDDTHEFYQTLSALLVPSTSFEACPMVVLEAYASGVPVVGSDLGGTPELIEETTGAVFPAGDSNALAGATRSVLEADVDYRSTCRQMALEQFSMTEQASQVEAVLWDLVGGRHHS